MSGSTQSGQKIIGQYRGVRPSFGSIIFGIIEGTTTPPELFTVLTLSLKALEKSPTLNNSSKKDFEHGDYCSGITKDSQKVFGYYQNKIGKFVYLRGWIEHTSRLTPKEVFKVLYSSLKRLDK